MTKKINTYIISFLIYSFVGWLYEVILEVCFFKIGFLDRGILVGPYCPIYGCGGLLLYFMLRDYKEKPMKIGKINFTPVMLFVSIMIITSIVELIGSYIMEVLTGSWMWDYSTYALNFQGRVAFKTSFRFGIGGMVFLYAVQPLINKICAKSSDTYVNFAGVAIALMLMVDTAYTFLLK